MDVKRFTKIFEQVVANVNTVIHGKDDVVRLALTAIVAEGPPDATRWRRR